MISTRIHGFMDYAMGALLIILPYIADFPQGVATTIPVVLGAGTIAYSLVTNYELGLTPILSMSAHLILDFIAGALLALSPWFFGFSDEIYLPFVVLGGVEILASLFTTRRREYPAEVNSGNTQGRNL